MINGNLEFNEVDYPLNDRLKGNNKYVFSMISFQHSEHTDTLGFVEVILLDFFTGGPAGAP